MSDVDRRIGEVSAPDTRGARGFGRGMVLLAAANAVYIVTAYAVTTVTARLLHPADFGAFGVLMGWVTMLTALLVRGVATATAREMGAASTLRQSRAAWWAGTQVGAVCAVALLVVGVAVAPVIGPALGGGAHTLAYAIAAVGAGTFGVNAVVLAWPTGMRAYGRQAAAQLSYAVARLVFVVGGAQLAGLTGAVAGYVIAPLASILPLVQRHSRATASDVRPIRRRMWSRMFVVSAASIAISALFVVDVFGMAAALSHSATQVGVYVAYGTVAHVPYFLLQAAGVALVPALASAVDRGDAIRRTVTDTAVLLAGPTMLLAAAGDSAARLVFGHAYHVTDSITLPLALATAAVTMLGTLVSVDVAIGRMRSALVVCAVCIGALAAASYVAARTWPEHAAGAVSWAALTCCCAAAVTLAIDVRRRHRALVVRSRFMRGALLGVVVALPCLLPMSDVARVVVAALCGLAWLATVIRARLVDVTPH